MTIARATALSLLVGSALALSGCVASIAASALSMAVKSAKGQPVSNQHLKANAEKDCSAHALQYGAVHIIDIEQRATNKIIVWGTVKNDKERRSFECSFGTKITGFKLRPIATRP